MNMTVLNIIFVAISAYLFCGWLVSEKNLGFSDGANRKDAYFMYYLWPVFLIKNRSN